MDALTLLIAAPQIEYDRLAPLIILLVGGCVGVLIEALVRRQWRDEFHLGVTSLSILAALAITISNWQHDKLGLAAMGSLSIDGPSYFIWTALLIFGLLAMFLFAERRVNGGTTSFTPMAASVPGSTLEAEAGRARFEHTEVFPLLLFALLGMMMFPASNDLITMFVALEIFSLPLYLLTGLARRRRLLSQEAALKYFLLGSLSSAMFLYGMALLYGYSGSFTLADIDKAIALNTQSQTLLLAGLGLVAIGLLFKVGAVPFHSWTPDVYTGAPSAVTGFMAICTKMAAVGAMLRIFYVALGAARWDWQPLFATIAVLTMAVGAVVAIAQTDVKRMLAYSSIAHAGFLLVGLVGATTAANGLPSGQVGSVAAILVYLVAYGFATLGAFALVTMVRKSGGEATGLSQWQGLGRSNPVIASLMTLFLLSFAGIPLTAGFVGKLLVFIAAWRGGYMWLVFLAIVFSLVAAFFYVRMIVLMFFREKSDDEVEVVRTGAGTWAVVWVGAIMTVVLGVYGGPLVDLAVRSATFLR